MWHPACIYFCHISKQPFKLNRNEFQELYYVDHIQKKKNNVDKRSETPSPCALMGLQYIYIYM